MAGGWMGGWVDGLMEGCKGNQSIILCCRLEVVSRIICNDVVLGGEGRHDGTMARCTRQAAHTRAFQSNSSQSHHWHFTIKKVAPPLPPSPLPRHYILCTTYHQILLYVMLSLTVQSVSHLSPPSHDLHIEQDAACRCGLMLLLNHDEVLY